MSLLLFQLIPPSFPLCVHKSIKHSIYNNLFYKSFYITFLCLSVLFYINISFCSTIVFSKLCRFFRFSKFVTVLWWYCIIPLGFLDDTVVKNLPANAGDSRDVGLIPGSGRFLGLGNGTCSIIHAWRIPWTEESGKLLFMGPQRVEINWVTKHTQSLLYELFRKSIFIDWK